jgi:rhodanese-related sulfurtransferase
MIVSTDEVLKHISEKGLLIDVRESKELIHGLIPSAKHIPLGILAEAFMLDSNLFEQTYGFTKPTFSDVIVVYCRTGSRSALAADILSSLGYKVANYKGSIWAWSQIDASVKRYF